MVGTLLCDKDGTDALRAGLKDLRGRLATEMLDHDGVFHASEDRQAIRDRVFDVVLTQPEQALRFDATALEKAKAIPSIRPDEPRFYKHAWFFHLKHLLPRVCRAGDLVHVVLSDIGTKKERAAFREAVGDVMALCRPSGVRVDLAFWKNSADECLQAADYLLWAVARRHERNDSRSYDQIAPLIKSDYDLFARGKDRWY